ncbi:MAG: rod shape-determining protein MreC [Gemmatimonadota bacterium]
MLSFLKKWWRLLAAVALMIAVAQLFLRPPSALRSIGPLRGVAAVVFRPVYATVDFVHRGLASFWGGYVALTGVARENERLRREIAALRDTIQANREEVLENRRLKELLRFSETIARPTIGARVVGHDVSPWFQGLFIDVGGEAGVEPGMSVVTPGGGIGRIYKVYRGLSEVILVTDGRFAADVIVERSRVRAVAEGAGGGVCSLKYVSPTQDVVAGDRVLFSGFDGSMPKGTLLGTVVSAQRPREGLFQHIRVVSAVDFLAVEEVLVVLARPSIPFRAERP